MAAVVARQTRIVNAPRNAVWRAIKDPQVHAAWHPFVRSITGTHGLGKERSCSVAMNGREGTTKERCVAYEEGVAIEWRIEEDTMGFVERFREMRGGLSVVEDGADRTRVTATTTIVPSNWIMRLMAPMIRRRMGGMQRKILDGLADHMDGMAPAKAP